MDKINIKALFNVGNIPCEIVLPITKENADALVNFKSGSEIDKQRKGYRAAKRISKIIGQIYLLLDIEHTVTDFDFEVKI